MEKGMRRLFIILGGLSTALWGISHLFPTAAVVKGFGNISADNQRIILMEWINEGLTLLFIGLLVIIATVMNKENTRPLKIIYAASSIMLFSMAVLSVFTGFKIDFLPFRLCPFIFTASGILILQGALRK